MKDWHSYSIDKVYEILKTGREGLNNSEVGKRLNKYGNNELPSKKKESIVVKFFKQLLNPIVMLLASTVIISLFIGELVDAIAIFSIIIIDLTLGTYQEYKAEKNAEALSKMIVDTVKVLRNNKKIEVNSSDIVVGDIIYLESGDKISADARIIECDNLQVDESLLTGESASANKFTDVLGIEVLLADRDNMLYAGTNVITGRAKAVVVATGINTEIGKIADTVNSKKDTKSPLTIRIERFSKQISILVIINAIVIITILLSKGISGSEIFLSVVALSVSTMPEGLPLAVTVALSVASSKMAKQNVIVKKLNSVETLGSCTVIATDKTGTLTVNEQTAKKVLLPDNSIYEIEGTGYSDKGNIITNDDIDKLKYISKLGIINNEGTIEKKKKKIIPIGDSIDVAFLILGMKTNVNKDDIEIIDVIHYESEKKYSAVFYKYEDKIHCTVKGSIEKVIDFSNNMMVNNNREPIDSDFLIKQNEDLAKEGYRVIALADGIIKTKKESYTEEDIKELNFYGLVGFIDPIREEAKVSVNECKTAGIKVIMVTGDHPLTAFAIGKELGIVTDYSEVTTGLEVSKHFKLGQKEFDNFIKDKKVFTRVTPMDKLEIVESLKRNGEFVAVTGDGVNDAPAIKSGNIGIAMGSGTDVSKETATMIITDDNFKSIVTGIKEGRTAYSNIRKVAYMLLSCGFAEVFFFIMSIVLDLPMPLVAIQLLWLNIVTDGLQDFSLSFEKSEKNIMKEKPRNPKESIFDKDLLIEVLLSGLTIGIIVFSVWYFLLTKLNMEVSLARGYIMVLMVFMQNIHVFNCRSEKQSAFKMSIKDNPLIVFSIVVAIILQIIIMEVPILSHFLQTSTVPITDMLILLMISSIILFVMELYKMIRYRN